jgi:hypothetical protein
VAVYPAVEGAKVLLRERKGINSHLDKWDDCESVYSRYEAYLPATNKVHFAI